MGLNTVRLEGKLETEEFFEMADRTGILVMAGWCCCDFWEHWGSWKDEDFEIAKASLRDQIYRLRSHPSMVMWLNGSDNPPPADVEAPTASTPKPAWDRLSRRSRASSAWSPRIIFGRWMDRWISTGIST